MVFFADLIPLRTTVFQTRYEGHTVSEVSKLLHQQQRARHRSSELGPAIRLEGRGKLWPTSSATFAIGRLERALFLARNVHGSPIGKLENLGK